MSVRVLGLVFVFAAAASACVDGKTPDCTSVDSGCFPEDSGSTINPDASDASDASDANNASDVTPDGPTPVTDAATD